MRKILGGALVLLALAALYLSWGALYDLARLVGGMAEDRAIVFPAVVDLVTVVAMLLAIVAPDERRAPRAWAWITLAVFGLITVAGNAAHVVSVPDARLALGQAIATGVNAVPAIALLLTTHLIAVSTRSRLSVATTPAPERPAAKPVADRLVAVERKPRRPRVDPAKRAEVVAMRAEQPPRSFSDIEAATGVPRATAARWANA